MKPFEIKIDKVHFSEDILRRWINMQVKDAGSSFNLREGDQVSMTDKTQEYEIVLELKSIKRRMKKR